MWTRSSPCTFSWLSSHSPSLANLQVGVLPKKQATYMSKLHRSASPKQILPQHLPLGCPLYPKFLPCNPSSSTPLLSCMVHFMTGHNRELWGHKSNPRLGLLSRHLLSLEKITLSSSLQYVTLGPMKKKPTEWGSQNHNLTWKLFLF